MPYLKIQTNVEREPGDSQPVLMRASALLSEQLGKPEKYVMVALESAVPMAFAGREAPTAFLELKSIDLPVERIPALSEGLCELVQDEFGIRRERIYIEFTDAPRAFWGWNGGTFQHRPDPRNSAAHPDADAVP